MGIETNETNKHYDSDYDWTWSNTFNVIFVCIIVAFCIVLFVVPEVKERLIKEKEDKVIFDSSFEVIEYKNQSHFFIYRIKDKKTNVSYLIFRTSDGMNTIKE
jgi:hypothetical protein